MFRWQHQQACSCPILQTTSLVQLDWGVVVVTDQQVVALAAEKVVGSDAAIKRVVATAAEQRVVASLAKEIVVADVAGGPGRGKQRTEIVARNCSSLRMLLGLAV